MVNNNTWKILVFYQNILETPKEAWSTRYYECERREVERGEVMRLSGDLSLYKVRILRRMDLFPGSWVEV